MDLDFLTFLPRAHYGVTNPVNAWDGASSEVFIWMLVVHGVVVQFGSDAVLPPEVQPQEGEPQAGPKIPVVWRRSRPLDGSSGWTAWEEAVEIKP